jgi:hypothetical protein
MDIASASLPASHGGGRLVQLMKEGGRQVYVEDLGNNLGPTMDKIEPAVFDLDLAALDLRQRLVQEVQFAAIVEFPR